MQELWGNLNKGGIHWKSVLVKLQTWYSILKYIDLS